MILYVTSSTGSMQLWPPDVAPEWPWIFINKYCWLLTSNQKSLFFLYFLWSILIFSIKIDFKFYWNFKNNHFKKYFFCLLNSHFIIFAKSSRLPNLKFFIAVTQSCISLLTQLSQLASLNTSHLKRISVSCHLTEQMHCSDKQCKNFKKL